MQEDDTLLFVRIHPGMGHSVQYPGQHSERHPTGIPGDNLSAHLHEAR